MALNLPPCPPNLKPISHFLKLAQEHGTHLIYCKQIFDRTENDVILE